MNQLCRLCLSVAGKAASELDKKSKLLDDLSSLNIQIIINDSLPTFVCVTCMKTLEIMLKFRETVLLNQCKLLDFLKNTKGLVTNHNLKQEDLIGDTIKVCTEFDDKDIQSENESDIICFEENNASKNDLLLSFPRKSHNESHKKSKLKLEEEDVCNKLSETNNLNDDPKNDSIQTKLVINTSNCNPTKQVYDLGYRKCLTCFTNLPSRKELIDHYKTAHTNEISKTQINSDNQENIVEDRKHVPDEQRNFYICKICGRTFPSVNHIVEHGRAHSERNLYCSHGCGYSTVYRAALRDHEKRHQKDYKYKCSTCGAGFHAKTWYDQHQNVHKNIKPFVCDLCSLAFHMDRYLKTHRLSVHSDVTKGGKRFMCPNCDKTFENIKHYKRHLETHEGKKVFLCDTCGKECLSSKQLQNHKYIHLGLKPYTCRICNKSFTKKHTLTVHSRAHSGLKYLCTTCGTHFAQQSTLRRHMKKFHPDKKLPNNESAESVEVPTK